MTTESKSRADQRLCGPTGPTFRVIQIHPTRLCNLRCLHCYSDSGPDQRGALPVDLLRRAVEDAAVEGYNVVGFSGGEPVLYSGLREVAANACALGLTTTVTSNGITLTPRRLEALTGVVSLLAISIDGVPESHDHMRASPTAFARMASRLADVRRSGIPFGFIFTLTRFNVHELDWVASFAYDEGAALLQIHPLEQVGRAADELRGDEPDGLESGVAMMEGVRLRERFGDRLRIQVDVASARVLRALPERVFADDRDELPSGPLGELPSPVVIEADATVVPLQYGFARAFALGNLFDLGLAELGARWKLEGIHAFRGICYDAFRSLEQAAHEGRVIDWYELVGAQASAAAPPAA